MPKPTPKDIEHEIAEEEARLSVKPEPLLEENEPADDFDPWTGRNTDR